MQTVDSGQILFVLGMHRSGTSALCAALAHCGVKFGPNTLQPMAGVNDDGFWEDEQLVALNQELLALHGSTWYAPPEAPNAIDWQSDKLRDLRRSALELLTELSGKGPLVALKDPRLCITLPFWQSVSSELQLRYSACVITRPAVEIAQSLQRRDGFPIAYGLRLCRAYVAALLDPLPEDVVYVTFNELLASPEAAMENLAKSLPLAPPNTGLGSVVKSDLRHHSVDSGADANRAAQQELAGVLNEVDADCNDAGLIRELVSLFVARGEQLTALGTAHSKALSTVEERDADIASLSTLHKEALAVINERDLQITELDERLQATGDHLDRALSTLRDKDAHIERVMRIPILGLLFRLMWKNARR